MQNTIFLKKIQIILFPFSCPRACDLTVDWRKNVF